MEMELLLYLYVERDREKKKKVRERQIQFINSCFVSVYGGSRIHLMFLEISYTGFATLFCRRHSCFSLVCFFTFLLHAIFSRPRLLPTASKSNALLNAPSPSLFKIYVLLLPCSKYEHSLSSLSKVSFKLHKSPVLGWFEIAGA